MKFQEECRIVGTIFLSTLFIAVVIDSIIEKNWYYTTFFSIVFLCSIVALFFRCKSYNKKYKK